MATFSVITPQHLLDLHSRVLDSAVAGTILTGYVAHLAADGEVLAAQTADAIGLFHDYLSGIEPPANANLVTQKAGKSVTVVSGRFRAYLSADMFDGGAGPTTPGAALYGDNVSGKIALSGTNVVGEYQGSDNTTRSAAGDVTLFECLFNFPVPAAN